MKAQRRHDLQTNTLAKVITKAPNWWQDSGGKLLLGVVIALAAFLLVRYRITSSRAAASKAADDVMLARQQIEEIQNTAIIPAPPAQLATQRRARFSEAAGKLDDVIRDGGDPDLMAEANLAKGDLNWIMATLPPVPGATTNPSLQVVKDPNQLLDAAADAYRAILSNYSNNRAAVVAAHFGLAAIAENQRKWDIAEGEYKAILAIPNLAKSYADQAQRRLDELALLKQSPIIAQPATLPALPPTVAAPTTGPGFGALGPNLVRPTTAAATTRPAPVAALPMTVPSSRPAPAPPAPLPPAPKPLATSTATTTRAP
jgi:hypothetical protein